MKALVINEYGQSTNLTYRDIEKPSITSHTQVIVKIHGAGVNPVDFKIRKGNLANLMKFQFPCVLGIDYSGTIDSVGTSVNHFTVGQQVYGKLAKPPVVEHTTKDVIFPKPYNATMDELAGVGVVALTAYIGLINHCQIDQGNKKRILIIGGSGGVGTWAIQIAKSFDIHVTTICSGKNTDFVKSLGADVILDYQKDLDAQLKSVDLFDGCFDCVGGDEYYHMISPRMNVKAVYSTAVGPEIHGGNHPVGISNVFGVIDKIVWRNLFGMSYKIHHKS